MSQIPRAHEYAPFGRLAINPSDESPVPYSGGSSLEANFSAPYGGMSIDFTFMDKIITLHADE
jgi:hypothetical protein